MLSATMGLPIAQSDSSWPVLFALVPLVSLLALVLLIDKFLIRRHLFAGWPQAVLLACVAWGVWLTWLTEILSVVKAFQFYPVLLGWALPGLIAFWFIRRWSHLEKIQEPLFAPSSRILLAGIACIVAVAGLIAFLSPPNNFDSMTYHLSRVMHWLQNRSVAHYPTHEVRQLYQNPGAEFIVAHLFLLSGSDQLANLVQWAAMVGCILGTSFVAGQLGAGPRGQILAALATATIPIGLLQAVNTQNDYVVSFWLVCLVSFILLIRQNFSWLYVMGIAGSLGLAILTKGTAYLFAAPFLIWLGWQIWQARSWSGWKALALVGLVLLLVNGGHYARNFQLFGSPLQPQNLGDFDYSNEFRGPAVIISNVVRNAALHVNILPPDLRTALQEAIQGLHHLLQLELNDPRTTWPGAAFTVNSFVVDEDVSGNFVHFLLFLAGLGVILQKRRRQNSGLLLSYTLLLVSAFLLFAAYLKWQPWHSRLHLPLFVLAAPIIGWLLVQLPYQPFLSNGLALLLLVQALPFLVANPLHPLLGRQNIFNQGRLKQYFIESPALIEPYRAAANRIIEQECDRVGLILPVDGWEYPFWVLLQQPASRPVQIEAVDVKNESAVLQRAGFDPCAVICMRCPEPSRVLYTGRLGPPVLAYGENFLFMAQALK